jgi:hypothetical protein
MGLETEINKSSANIFRRAYVKRRSADTGLYESDWQDITAYVKKWGSISAAVDDVKLNEFTYSGISLLVSNDEAKFNREDDEQSLWNGYLTRYKSLIKIEAGYTADDGTEYPTVSTQGIFIITNEIALRGNTNDVQLRGKSLISVFDEVRASDIASITGTMTASEVVTSIRDYTDGSGNYIFQQFISAGAWTIQTTTNNYVFNDTSALQDLSCWGLMSKLSESEGNILMINRTGGFEFRNRDPRTTASSFDIRGLGYRNMHIKSIPSFKEALNKTYNYFRVKFDEADTTTSFVVAGTTTSVDASNPSWKYGQRTYEMTNIFMDSVTADAVASNLYSLFATPKNEVSIDTKFVPHLEILDRLALYHRSYSIMGATLWDRFNWDEANWASQAGENFDFDGENYKVLSRKINLDNLTNNFILREI